MPPRRYGSNTNASRKGLRNTSKTVDQGVKTIESTEISEQTICDEKICYREPLVAKSSPPVLNPVSQNFFCEKYGIYIPSDLYRMGEIVCENIFEAILLGTTRNYDTISKGEQQLLLTTFRRELVDCYRGYYLRHLSDEYRASHSISDLKKMIMEDSGMNFDRYMYDFIGKRIGKRIILLSPKKEDRINAKIYGYEIQKIGTNGSWRASPHDTSTISFMLPPEHIFHIILSISDKDIRVIFMEGITENKKYFLFPGNHIVVDECSKPNEI